MREIPARVKEIIIEHLRVEEDKVTDDANFFDDLGADSLDATELFMALEDEFGCEIDELSISNILTVKNAITYLQEHATQ